MGLTGLLLLLTLVLLRPPLSDLVAMAGFLLASGGLTVAAALGLTRWNLPGWIGSLPAKIVLMAVLTAVLALLNVGFTAFLMFLSPHDLALLGGLLAFALGMAVFVAFSCLEQSAARYMSCWTPCVASMPATWKPKFPWRREMKWAN